MRRNICIVLAAVVYIVLISRGEVDLRAQLRRFPILLGLIWVIYVGEMILRFFPSRLESMGCQKQFRKNYMPTENGAAPTRRFRGVWMVVLSWKKNQVAWGKKGRRALKLLVLFELIYFTNSVLTLLPALASSKAALTSLTG